MAKLNTNSNAYTIGYASLMVIIVAFLLAFVASALKPTQDENVKLDTKKQILAALRITDCADVNTKYQEVFGTDELSTEQTFTANVDGEEKLVVVLKGAGLWGPIWGWASIDKDGETVYGTYFNHEGETAGLGARIKDDPAFAASFQGKKIFDGEAVGLSVLKKGKVDAGSEQYKNYVVDAVTGATLTSNGVNDMLQKCIADNKAAIEAFKNK